MKGKRRCSASCPPRYPDGSIVPPRLINLCLLCWNTGWQIPIGGKYTIDQWIEMHKGKEAPSGTSRYNKPEAP